ncbi:V-type ATPase subunit family protein, partial [Ostertagia ostertagi]
FITGVINRSKVISFERFIWRFCRGKVFVRTADITEKTELFDHDKDDDKAVFILFFSGDQLRSRVQKICAGFHATIYNCPESPNERAHLLAQINGQVGDMQSVIGKTLEYRHKIVFAAALSVKNGRFNGRSNDQSGSTVHAVLNEMETHKMPPTHFKLNKFTQGFQNIVDAYGIANYREVNPAPWSIISFPFLFAVMFGDSGHGIIMLLAALSFVVFEKKLISMKIKDEIFNTFFGGRYVVLLMGIFSIYTGFLYNDIYSKSINVFGSSWKNPYPESLLAHMEEQGHNNSQTLDLTFPPEYAFDSNAGPYPFGVDPVWNIAKNKLNFLNPMKMKTSIILGISQMTFGLLLSLCNHIHNRSVVDVLFVFVPQVFFLFCIFVYLCVMVVVKWIFFYVKPAFIFGRLYPGPFCAPSLLIGLISMFMLKARDSSVLALGCAAVRGGVRSVSRSMIHGDDEAMSEFNFGDVMVYQAIHTIEFALGCISHTASYLRLWALSLAHAQLSEVLWDMLLSIGLNMGGWGGSAAIFILYYFFGTLSISILILMEGLQHSFTLFVCIGE